MRYISSQEVAMRMGVNLTFFIQ